MRYTHNPADGRMITLGDLAAFVEEMRGYRHLPDTTPIRAQSVVEFDLLSGPRLRQLTADAEDLPAPPAPGQRAVLKTVPPPVDPSP